MTPPSSFAEFWPHYLRAHLNPTSRLLHYLGTFAGLMMLALIIATGRWWLLPIGIAIPYAFAWFGHFFVENNTPLAFTKPYWSFLGDLRMFGLALIGRLEPHLRAVRAA